MFATNQDTNTQLRDLDLTNAVSQQEETARAKRELYHLYHGTLDGDRPVAIKRLRFSLMDNRGLAMAFSDAIKDWSRLNHRNIVSFLGYTLTEEGFPSLITPWVCNLSVIEYVKANGEADTVHMVKGVADGLAYLHEQRIIHGDLRSDNVLVSDGKPLLTDFGMSRLLRTMQALRDIRDCMKNIRWMAVELVNPFSNHSTDEMNESGWSDSVTVERTMQTDVWAFGMVAYELISGTYPFSGLSDSQVLMRIAGGRLPKLPKRFNCPLLIGQSLWGLCRRCWHKDPTARPSMTSIVVEIKEDRSQKPSDEQSHVRAALISSNISPDASQMYPATDFATLSHAVGNKEVTEKSLFSGEPDMNSFVVQKIANQSTICRRNLEIAEDTANREIVGPDAKTTGILRSGMYEIINVHTKNHLGLEGDEIVSTTTPVHSDDLDGQNMVWHVEELRNANYAIKNGLRFASCGVRPNLDDCITVGAMLRQWIIKETRYKGQYIIQNSDVQLFWGLKDSELGTPITLQKYPTNPKNNWEFHLWKLHEQSGSLTKLVPTFNGSGSQTTVIVITSSSDSPQILPSSITSLISWNSHQNFNPSPSDGEIFNELRIYLGTQSLAAVTRSKARKAIMAKYPNADLTHRRQFLDESYRKILHERDVSDGTIR